MSLRERERLEALVGELADEIGHGEGIYGDADAVLASVADRLTAGQDAEAGA